MQYDVIMTPDYVIVSIKFYIIVCNVSGRRMSGFEVIGLLPGRRPGLNRVKVAYL